MADATLDDLIKLLPKIYDWRLGWDTEEHLFYAHVVDRSGSYRDTSYAASPISAVKQALDKVTGRSKP